MDNKLDQYFVTIDVYQDEQKIHSVITPRSLIHDMFLMWAYPGSSYNVRVIDHTGNFRINSTILDEDVT